MTPFRLRMTPVLLFLTVCWLPLNAAALDLDEALRITRSNAVELMQQRAELERAEFEARQIDGSFDWTTFGRAQWYHDRSEQTSEFAGKWRDNRSGELGARRLFESATFLESKFTHQREYTEFPEPDPPPSSPAPGIPAVPTFDPSEFQSYNPAYTTRFEVTARQPLWRNWLGRELDLQRSLASAGTIAPRHQIALRTQFVQAETEQLYWSLAALSAQEPVLRELVQKSKRFVELMQRRARLGRADEVDVASAESALVAREGALLNIQLAREEVLERLTLRLYPFGETQPATDNVGIAQLSQPQLPLPTSTPEAALDLAERSRIDLKLINANRKTVRDRAALAREEGKPSISLFGTLGTNGLDDIPEVSMADAFDDLDHMTYAIGIEAEINFERSTSRAKMDAARASLAVLDAQALQIRREVRREVQLAFQGARAAKRQLDQAERHVQALSRKLSAARSLYDQARTDAIAVVSYELEVLNARLERIDAYQSARQAAAQLRTALHAYPSETER